MTALTPEDVKIQAFARESSPILKMLQEELGWEIFIILPKYNDMKM